MQLPVTEYHSPTLIECGAKMTIQGTVAGRACVHSRSSVSDALQVETDSVIQGVSPVSVLMLFVWRQKQHLAQRKLCSKISKSLEDPA